MTVGAQPLGAVHDQRAAVLLDDTPRPGESDARPRDDPRDVCAAVEALGHVRQVGGGDADAQVPDLEDGMGPASSLLSLHARDHRASTRAVLDGVAEHVVEDPSDPLRVDERHQRRLAGRERDSGRLGAALVVVVTARRASPTRSVGRRATSTGWPICPPLRACSSRI